MQLVWIVGLPTIAKDKNVQSYAKAELCFVETIAELQKNIDESDRLIIIANHLLVEELRAKLGAQILAIKAFPDSPNALDVFSQVLGIVLHDAKVQHDMEAAEAIAWVGVRGEALDDPFLEHLGEYVLQIAASPDLQAVEEALLAACKRMAPVDHLRLISHPQYLNVRQLGKYRLAIPIEFNGELKAHIYVKFSGPTEQKLVEYIGEVLLSLSDAVALAVDRARMLEEAERNRTIWEASFDAVGDPLAILSEEMTVLRSNRAYKKVFGKNFEIPGLDVRDAGEWDVIFEKRIYRAFLENIPNPLEAGRYIFLLRDITEERNLTEKLLAKESVSEMGILVSSIAHEVANPIGGILATSQVLLKELPEGSEEREDVARIAEAAGRAAKIVQTMLSLARKSDETRSEVTLRDCVSLAADLLMAEAKRLGVKIDLDESLNESVLLYVNKNRLMQVFFHLFQQSLNAITEKKKSVENRKWFCKADLVQGEQIELHIVDNGDPITHQYEAQSSVAFTVSKMILEELGATLEYGFGSKGENKLTLKFPRDIAL